MVLYSICHAPLYGSGIMSLPETLEVLGLVPGVALIIIAAFLTETSIEMLLRFSKPRSAFSYSDLMGDAFGTIGKILLQISVIVNNIGVLLVYMIIIGVISMISPSCVSVHLLEIRLHTMHHFLLLAKWYLHLVSS